MQRKDHRGHSDVFIYAKARSILGIFALFLTLLRILSFKTFGGFKKNDDFWGMTILWIFWGLLQNWTVFWGHFYVLRFFSLGQGGDAQI